MIDNPAGISRRIIFFIGNGNRFLCYLSLSASAHRKKVAAAFAAVLHGCVMFQPLFYTFHIIFTRYNCLIYVYGRETGAFVAIYPPFQGTDTPRFHIFKNTVQCADGVTESNYHCIECRFVGQQFQIF